MDLFLLSSGYGKTKGIREICFPFISLCAFEEVRLTTNI